MIFLQCVGSVCQSIKRAYLQGGSEMITRKNKRKTKSSGHRAHFPRVKVLLTAYRLPESERWGRGNAEWQVNMSWLTGRAYKSSASESSASRPNTLPAKNHQPNPLETGHRKHRYMTELQLNVNLG